MLVLIQEPCKRLPTGRATGQGRTSGFHRGRTSPAAVCSLVGSGRSRSARSGAQSFYQVSVATGDEANLRMVVKAGVFPTERAVRGSMRVHQSDGLFRTHRRNESTGMAARLKEVVDDLRAGKSGVEAGSEAIHRTRAQIVDGWTAVAFSLRATGEHELAERVQRFRDGMPLPLTEKAGIARRLLERFPVANAVSRMGPPSHEPTR